MSVTSGAAVGNIISSPEKPGMIRSESAFVEGPSLQWKKENISVENGGQLPIDRLKPLKFTEAVRLHETLSAHNISV